MNLQERLDRPDWKPLAYAVKVAAGGKCSLCGCRFPQPFLGLEVHHNTYARLGRELMSDLIALCGFCHANHTWRKKNGDLVAVRCAEMLGIIERIRPTLAEIHEFYWADVRRLSNTLDEVQEEVGMLLAATDAGRYGEERRAA